MSIKFKTRSKLITFYTFSFIIFFIVLFSLNFFYKKIIGDLSVGYKYTFSAQQYFGFKEKSLENLLDKFFSDGEKISKNVLRKKYQIQNKNIENFSLTLNNLKSSIVFDLITKNYFDEEDLENKINNAYIGPVKKIIIDIENNRDLYDYDLISKQYIENKNNEVDVAFKKLINSEFFKIYKPKQSCRYTNTEICYDKYSRYYMKMLFSLKEKELTMSLLNELNITDETIKEQRIVKILEDFQTNRHLFDSLYLSEITTTAEDELEYFSTKYNKLINSDFFSNYMPETFCQYYNAGCFKNLSAHFNTILSKHKREGELPFKVNYIPTKKKFNFFSEIPLIIGITALITYLFFIVTNKFLVRKLR